MRLSVIYNLKSDTVVILSKIVAHRKSQQTIILEILIIAEFSNQLELSEQMNHLVEKMTCHRMLRLNSDYYPEENNRDRV